MITLTENTLYDNLKKGVKYAGMVAAPAAVGLGLGHLYGAYQNGDMDSIRIADRVNRGLVTPEAIYHDYGTLVKDPTNMTPLEKLYVGNVIHDKAADVNQTMAANNLPERYYTNVDTMRGLGGVAGAGLGAGAAYLASRNNKK